MINIENLSKTLANIKKYGPEHSNMDYYFTEDSRGYDICSASTTNLSQCGTTACIFGHAASVMVSEGLEVDDSMDVMMWLGVESPGSAEYRAFIDLSIKEYWGAFGEIGIRARKMAKDTNDYEGMVFLLEKIIELKGRFS